MVVGGALLGGLALLFGLVVRGVGGMGGRRGNSLVVGFGLGEGRIDPFF